MSSIGLNEGREYAFRKPSAVKHTKHGVYLPPPKLIIAAVTTFADSLIV